VCVVKLMMSCSVLLHLSPVVLGVNPDLCSVYPCVSENESGKCVFCGVCLFCLRTQTGSCCQTGCSWSHDIDRFVCVGDRHDGFSRDARKHVALCVCVCVPSPLVRIILKQTADTQLIKDSVFNRTTSRVCVCVCVCYLTVWCVYGGV